jgi:cytochrome c peroxidase
MRTIFLRASMRGIFRLLAFAVAIAARATAADYKWDLPRGFPPPRVPADNPMSNAKVQLGRYLFYDTRMSANGKQSCASCHRQELAFTDGRATAVGTTGQDHPRSAMSLVNVAYLGVLTWSDSTLHTLEEQALIPILSEHPVELGLKGRVGIFLRQLAADKVYRPLFAQAFPAEKDPYTLANVAKALAGFERTIISADSPYDRFYFGGDATAISDSAQRGQAIFFGDQVAIMTATVGGKPAGCFRCHSGFNFSDATVYRGSPNAPIEFHNTALYDMPGTFHYPWPNLGIYRQTKKPADAGKFRTPPLRNIELTAPYMHDGSIATLEEVLDHYADGGRTIATGPYAGRGHDNPYRDARMTGFTLTPQNRQDLLAFLRSLTDLSVTRDPRFSNPW